jgi:hypothetical protein
VRNVRPLYIGLIGLAVLLFLAISAVLARVFSLDGAERTAITSLVQAEAAGNTQGVLKQIQGCGASAACRVRVNENIAQLRHSGAVTILQLNPSAGFSLGATTGIARVAWEVGSSLPRVQCVRVKRAGNAISGFRIELLEVSPKIESDSDCPASF